MLEDYNFEVLYVGLSNADDRSEPARYEVSHHCAKYLVQIANQPFGAVKP